MKKEDINEVLIKNAKDALAVGFEDYCKHKDDPKRIKSSLRNIYAGIELLLKSYINTLSPKESNNYFLQEGTDYQITEERVVVFGISGSKTISSNKFKTIIKRHEKNEEQKKHLLEILTSIEMIKSIRNDLEHSYNEHPIQVIKFSIFDSYECIKKIDNVFQTKISNEVMSEDDKKLFEDRLRHYRENIKPRHTDESSKYVTCIKCNSYMLRFGNSVITDTIKCEDCEKEFSIRAKLDELSQSKSFQETHRILSELQFIHEKVLVAVGKKGMVDIANQLLNNTQVVWIPEDRDVHDFLSKVHIALLRLDEPAIADKFRDILAH